ncbi:MAG: DJ-1/PfpI family protein [Clostridia bacterium]|nr:DJ-1/PfpI family protein [Clostridia bacterium]
MIYVFLADGFEECEAIAPIDILRRAGLTVKTVGIGGKEVNGSHGIQVKCDLDENEIDFDGLQGVILPGGMPGTLNLEQSATVQNSIDFAVKNNLLIGAICAAPSILGHKGLLKGRKTTCFTGFEKELIGAEVVSQPAVRDGSIITAYGAGAAFDFGFLLLEALSNKSTSDELKQQMRYTK